METSRNTEQGYVTWSDVVGLAQLTDNLQNAIKHNKISHAYLIQGEKLSGKRMVADLFARALQWEGGRIFLRVRFNVRRARRLPRIRRRCLTRQRNIRDRRPVTSAEPASRR